uniref:Uncharacterized protein n=1 Tax=Clytia hemisphaerica TaxID=252671 RepID=A0A7M5WR82_9CNID
MLKAFREQSQAWLEAHPISIGGIGQNVLVKRLRECKSENPCQILIIIWGDQNRLLLHDHDGRYSNQSQIPILAQTTVFAENNYLFPDGVITSNQVELFIGGAESEI